MIVVEVARGGCDAEVGGEGCVGGDRVLQGELQVEEDLDVALVEVDADVVDAARVLLDVVEVQVVAVVEDSDMPGARRVPRAVIGVELDTEAGSDRAEVETAADVRRVRRVGDPAEGEAIGLGATRDVVVELGTEGIGGEGCVVVEAAGLVVQSGNDGEVLACRVPRGVGADHPIAGRKVAEVFAEGGGVAGRRRRLSGTADAG